MTRTDNLLTADELEIIQLAIDKLEEPDIRDTVAIVKEALAPFVHLVRTADLLEREQDELRKSSGYDRLMSLLYEASDLINADRICKELDL